jgi:hypothetical protein
MWEPRRLTTLWVSSACYRDSFTFLGQAVLGHKCSPWKQSIFCGRPAESLDVAECCTVGASSIVCCPNAGSVVRILLLSMGVCPLNDLMPHPRSLSLAGRRKSNRGTEKQNLKYVSAVVLWHLWVPVVGIMKTTWRRVLQDRSLLSIFFLVLPYSTIIYIISCTALK